MAVIRWTKIALKDLNSIYDFISVDSVFFAKQEIDGIYRRVLMLEKQTRLGRIVPEFQDENIRELIKGNYRIIYRIRSEQSISIIRIHHRARLLSRL